MRILLDTHAFLWAVLEPGKLTQKTRELLEDTQTDISISAASAWEIATKFRLGKMPGAANVVTNYPAAIRGLLASELAVTSAHALKAGAYPHEHRDPFDRMLAAQSEIEGLPIVSCDPALEQFGVNLLW